MIESNICLLPMVTGFARECLALHQHYKNGFLPRAGGLYSQPNKYLQAMGVIDGNSAA